MGYAHIVTIYDDGISGGMTSSQEKIAQELGQSVLKVCLHPDHEPTVDGNRRIKEGPVLNHGNYVQWVDEVHSNEARVYLWHRNCLRPALELETEELEVALKSVHSALQQKKSG